MCFSPEMDLVAGVVISGVGIDTLRRVRDPKHLPLASLPLVFGVHQLVETLVWWELQGQVCREAGGIAAPPRLMSPVSALPPWPLVLLTPAPVWLSVCSRRRQRPRRTAHTHSS